MTHLHRVKHGSARATFDLDDGARLTSLVLGGHSLILGRDGQDPLWWGAFVMAPWTSLLRSGAFDFDGVRQSLPSSDIEGIWHGVLWDSPWQLAEDGMMSGRLDEPWPFGGSVTMQAILDDDALELHLRLLAGTEPMPGAIGWHPWFPRSLEVGGEVELVVPSGALVQERDAEGLPTGEWAPPVRRWNDCLRTEGPIDLVYPGAGTVRVSYSGDYVTLFTLHPQGVCVEPVTSQAERMDHRLEPGEELLLTIRVGWLAESSGDDCGASTPLPHVNTSGRLIHCLN